MTNKIIITNNFKNSSIVKVDNIAYMPKPSYESFPAIPIYTSTDDVNWELVNHVFKDSSKLNLYAIDSGCGVCSPTLSHDGKKFYLVYSIVRNFGGNNLTLDNYIMSATNIMKKWSEPVYLNSNKTASTLIHYDDKCYLISLRVNIETEYERTRCIVIQEYDKKKATLVGEETIIAKPLARGELFSEICFEKEENEFKLTLVEYTNKKRSTVLTSTTLDGMYHILKFVDDTELEEDVAEILEVVENIDHINSIDEANETVQGIIDSILDSKEKVVEHTNYKDVKGLGTYSLREELDDSWYKKTKIDDGYKVSLRGRNGLASKYEQSFVGKSVTNANFTFQTTLNFKPENLYQSAGIACYYSANDFYYLRFFKSESFGGLTVGITSTLNGEKFEMLHHSIKLGDMIEKIHMKVEKNNNQLQFSYSLFSNSSWVNVSTPIDVARVEARNDGNLLVGITAQDKNNKSTWADFYGMNLT